MTAWPARVRIASSSGQQVPLDALARVTNGAFDLVLLDLGLPGMSGFDVIRRVRVLFPALPIIVLSAQGEDAPKVEALDLGADDYVAKPFSVRELLARVRVALRHGESAAGALAESSSVERGSIRLDLAEHSATVRGEVVSLTRTQFALLACFTQGGSSPTARSWPRCGVIPMRQPPTTCACRSRSCGGGSRRTRGIPR